MAAGTWQDDENDAIVADCFAMLAKELAGQPFSKTAQRRALQDRIGRGEGSIEYKHQNISAVLVGLGETWIVGYRPAFNYQRALEDAILRCLAVLPGASRLLRSAFRVGAAGSNYFWGQTDSDMRAKIP